MTSELVKHSSLEEKAKPMGLIIDARTKTGFGAAHKTVKFQMLHVALEFPEIKDVFPATINIQLNNPLWIRNPDHTTPPLPWWDVVHSTFAVEIFSFVRIKFEYPLNASLREAWIYIAHNSPHMLDPCMFELISDKIPNLTSETPCRVHIDKGQRADAFIV
jgi:hypothetical protein